MRIAILIAALVGCATNGPSIDAGVDGQSMPDSGPPVHATVDYGARVTCDETPGCNAPITASIEGTDGLGRLSAECEFRDVAGTLVLNIMLDDGVQSLRADLTLQNDAASSDAYTSITVIEPPLAVTRSWSATQSTCEVDSIASNPPNFDISWRCTHMGNGGSTFREASIRFVGMNCSPF